MRERITILDAGIGNLGNVERALRHVGADPVVTSDAIVVRDSRRIVLPGVGAFRPPRERLRGALEDGLREALAGGAWLLGICVGYQLLFEAGEEFGVVDGLHLVDGRVVELPEDVARPHIGWNELHWSGTPQLLRGLQPGCHAYFVHSFAPVGVPADATLATTRHGREFPSIVGAGRVLGTQFHPEKSGEVGLAILRNFVELSAEDEACN